MTARRPARVAVALGLVVVATLPPGVGSEPRMRTAEVAGERVHEVRKGETLGGIAIQYGVPVAAIIAANRLPGPNAVLRVGRRLTIPPVTVAGPPIPRTAPARRRPAAPPTIPAGLVLSIPDFDVVTLPFAWPVDGFVTSMFGRRRSGWHRGIDIKAEPGAPVLAAAGGIVVASGIESTYGRVVKIEHDNNFVTVYAHNSRNTVEVGDRIWPGQRIAFVGQTGRATTPHVHFEIRYDGRVYNPLFLLPLPPRTFALEDVEEHDEQDDE
ncbi:MAG TPA: LysM peptidoglycan-binding domain-containing M23 family metallopeptidase [Methylomirabilota bacterium]|jgi:murein DD-endopeptidase MepM/ murein hydrolase activator NlpD